MNHILNNLRNMKNEDIEFILEAFDGNTNHVIEDEIVEADLTERIVFHSTVEETLENFPYTEETIHGINTVNYILS